MRPTRIAICALTLVSCAKSGEIDGALGRPDAEPLDASDAGLSEDSGQTQDAGLSEDAGPPNDAAAHEDAAPRSDASMGGARFPLVLVADVPLPGNASRFDYEDLDVAEGHLVIAHMNDASVLVVSLEDGSLVKLFPGIPIARGVVIADDVHRIFVTSSPNTLVLLDNVMLTEVARVRTGRSPDGVAWDPTHQIVGVSDQADGTISLIPEAGTGVRTAVPLGVETGNVVYDVARGWFWAAVVNAAAPNQLVAIDPIAARVTMRIDLPGCAGAHGVRLHPDGQSALLACEDNNVLVRVDLGPSHAIASAATGAGPDVLSIDPGLGLLYVAAESGNLVVFDIGAPGLAAVDREHPGNSAHSVAVDPATHRVFFPLVAGPNGTPILRIMRPVGL